MSDNPYAAPQAAAAALSIATQDDESKRRRLFREEGHVRAVGLLAYFWCVTMALAFGGLLLALVIAEVAPHTDAWAYVLTGFTGVTAFVLFRAGRRLRRVEPEGRTDFALGLLLSFTASATASQILGRNPASIVAATVIPLVALASLWRGRNAEVFELTHQVLIARTRHLVAPSRGWVLWLLVISCVGLVAALVLNRLAGRGG